MTIFLVDGKEHRLTILSKQGIDYSADFIGNTAHGMQQDEEGRYIATQEDLDWWQQVLIDHAEMSNLIDQYVEKHSFEVVFAHLAGKGIFDLDLDNQLRNAKEALAELD